MRYEDSDGRTFIFYTDIDRLEKHLLEFSPQDEKANQGVHQRDKDVYPLRHSIKTRSLLLRLRKQIKTISNFIIKGKRMQEWMKITAENLSQRFKDPAAQGSL